MHQQWSASTWKASYNPRLLFLTFGGFFKDYLLLLSSWLTLTLRRKIIIKHTMLSFNLTWFNHVKWEDMKVSNFKLPWIMCDDMCPYRLDCFWVCLHPSHSVPLQYIKEMNQCNNHHMTEPTHGPHLMIVSKCWISSDHSHVYDIQHPLQNIKEPSLYPQEQIGLCLFELRPHLKPSTLASCYVFFDQTYRVSFLSILNSHEFRWQHRQR